MGGGHDMHGGHGGGVKGFVSNLVGGGKGHGHGHGQGYGYGGHGQQHGYPAPAAGACPPYGGYPAHGYAPAAYPTQPAPHHGGHMGMGSYQTGHGGGGGHGHFGGKHKGGGMFGGKHSRKWK